MAIIRTNISPRLRGGVGDFSYYTTEGYQLVRPRRNASNYGNTARRTVSQQERRAKWGNLVNVYQSLSPWIGKCNKMYIPSKKGLSMQHPAAVFIGNNINVSTAYLTKEEASLGAAVLQRYQVSKGRLPSIDCNVIISMLEDTPAYMRVSVNAEDTPTSSMPTSVFSGQLINENGGRIKNGDRLSYIIFTNYLDSDGVPRLTSEVVDFVVNVDNQQPMSGQPLFRYMNELNEGRLFLTVGLESDDVVGAAFIQSRIVNGSLQVSSQFAEPAFFGISNQFSSSDKRIAAINSYGVEDSSRLVI